MFNFNSRLRDSKYYALFDITSSSVGVGIVVKTKENSHELLWHKRVEFGYQRNEDYNRYTRAMYATLLEVGMKMTSEGFKYVREKDQLFSVKRLEVLCVLAPPWFMGVVSNVVQKKEMPFYVTENVIKTMKKKAFSNISESQEILSWKEIVGDFSVLESHSDIILIDGYCVNFFEHHKARELSVQFYFAITPDAVQKHIEEVLNRVFPSHNLLFLTSTRLFSNTEVLFEHMHEKRSVLTEVEGEITSISILKNGVVAGIVTIPFGINHLLKSVSPKASGVKEARDSVEIFLKKNTNLKQEVLPKKLQSSLDEWLQEVSNAVKILSNGVTPPQDFILVVDLLLYPLYKFALEQSWEMPGVRKSLKLNIKHVNVLADNEKTEIEPLRDTRIYAFASLLHNCTHKKGICYT